MMNIIYTSVLVTTALTTAVVIAGLNHMRKRFILDAQPRLARAATTGGALIAGWFLLAVYLTWTGVYRFAPNVLPPRIAFGILLPLAIGAPILLTRNPLRNALDRVPLPWLIGVQFYRAVGVVFLILLARHQLPPTFAHSAGWGDVITGLAAPLVAISVAKRWKHWFPAVIAWNLFGALDLFMAISLGMGSTPGPLRFIFENPDSNIMAAFPMALIPTFAVPFSLLLHLQTRRMACCEYCKSHDHNENTGMMDRHGMRSAA